MNLEFEREGRRNAVVLAAVGGVAIAALLAMLWLFNSAPATPLKAAVAGTTPTTTSVPSGETITSPPATTVVPPKAQWVGPTSTVSIPPPELPTMTAAVPGQTADPDPNAPPPVVPTKPPVVPTQPPVVPTQPPVVPTQPPVVPTKPPATTTAPPVVPTPPPVVPTRPSATATPPPTPPPPSSPAASVSNISLTCNRNGKNIIAKLSFTSTTKVDVTMSAGDGVGRTSAGPGTVALSATGQGAPVCSGKAGDQAVGPVAAS
jgi:outer membrane biosynthesis protein TonB